MGPIAERVRREAGLPVSSAWGFGEPAIAEQAVADQQLDLVMVGKAHLANPNWAYYAARELRIDKAPGRCLLPMHTGSNDTDQQQHPVHCKMHERRPSGCLLHEWATRTAAEAA